MNYDTWKSTEPESQDGLQQCPQCGKATDCLYPMKRNPEGQWREITQPYAEQCNPEGYYCYRCCNELEGAE